MSRALDAALAILGGNNDCADFFSQAKIEPTQKLASTDIVTVNGPDRNTFGVVNGETALVPPYLWDARTQPGAGGFMQLNSNGGFYQSRVRNVVQGGGRLPTTPLAVGPYLGGSLGAQVSIL